MPHNLPWQETHGNPLENVKSKRTLLQYENVLLDGVGSLFLDGVGFFENSRVGLRKGLIAEEVMGLK